MKERWRKGETHRLGCETPLVDALDHQGQVRAALPVGEVRLRTKQSIRW